MKKDPDLESALSRNRRWIVDNEIKNIILRCPNQVAPLKHLQKKFKSLDLQGKALNWLKKYPCCFEVYLENDEYHCWRKSSMEIELLAWNSDLAVSAVEASARKQGIEPSQAPRHLLRVEQLSDYTVLLREAYDGSELVDKDPLVIVKNKFGELMQEGLQEYNQRCLLVNLEKKKKGMNLMKSERRKVGNAENSDQDDNG
ncbi:hypothetical protein F3Y22_tig00117047pilonHSYRG00003 [Hibiscus syriacus]|uniref:PORR domain-containing protein n=1 Tax=Hibiscus syriacus TaxID=106335 RepID=A0A6A2WF17_HIBSY|nr:hypothetical protein F3Y22_tig00117047pilonHSYRG00003 [Hibiscus syriacus]